MSAGDVDADADRGTYTESEVIMSTVRVVTPFVLTFGLYVTFHGADSPGGGFQGGAIVGAMILMLAFAFGVDPARDWLDRRVVVGMMGLGVVVFVGVGLGSITLGGSFLQYDLYGGKKVVKYAIELVELGIGIIVAGVITSLFFLIDAGWGIGTEPEEEDQ